MLSFGLAAVIIAFIGNIFLSLFTLFKNPKSSTNRLFFLFTLSLTFYLWFNYLITHQSTDEGAFFWVKMVMSIALFINLFFFLLASTFPQPKLQTKPIIFWLAIISSLLLVPLAQAGLIFKNAKVSGEAGEPGIAMLLFLLHTVLLLGGGFILLIKKFRQAMGIEKIQIQLFLLGTVFMFISILVTNLLFVLVLKTAAFINLLPIYTLIFVGFISYAIVKHRFLDIGLIVARTVSFALLIGISSIAYTFLFGIASSFFISSVDLKTIITLTVLTLFIAASFQPLRRVLEKLTDRIFYKDKYDSNKLLYDLALIMASTLKLEDLTHQLMSALLDQMRITRGAFILTEENKIYDVAYEGYDAAPEIDEQKIVTLQNKRQALVFDELPEEEIKQIMRDCGFSIVVPLHTGGEDLGLLALGEKKSGDIYSSEDIKVLEIVVPEMAVAIQNSKSYEEISRFNITLQQQVNIATWDLQKANQKLQNLDKLKDDFVSVASHELRTPMTAIRSYVWMALHRPDIPLSEKMKRYLYRTLISTERLINLVNDMLNVSRIEAGTIEIAPKSFDMLILVKDVLEEVKPKADEKLIRLEVADLRLPPVFADPDKVHQILLNLIGNSLKFTPPDGIIEVGFFCDGKVLEVSVKDTGCGIGQDDLTKLFHKFSRLENSYVSMGTSGGTGLGLYISKSLVELMHGMVWAHSDGLGKGTTVTFSLPLVTDDLLKNEEKYHIKPMGEAKVLEPVAI